jgi:methanogenic corrinoid protein MtbC1
MIKWLITRQDEGMRINHAIELWRSYENMGKNPFEEEGYISSESLMEQKDLVSGSTLEDLRDEWIGACLKYDENNAERILAQAFALYPTEMVCLNVVLRGISEVGTLWYEGKVTVQQEHFISNLVVRRLNALIAGTPPPSRHEKIIVACPPGEEHVIAPLICTLFLRRHGWGVVYLGANVPHEHLDQAVKKAKVNLVILCANRLETAATLLDLVQAFDHTSALIAFGGSIFSRLPKLILRIPGIYLGNNLAEVVAMVDKALSSPLGQLHDSSISDEYQQAIMSFNEHQTAIQSQVWLILRSKGMTADILRQANVSISKNIIAALIFGDINYLRMEIDWARVLIQNQQLSSSLLPEYLGIFAMAIKNIIGEEGHLIFNMLKDTEQDLIDRR